MHGDDWSDNEGDWPENSGTGLDDSALSADRERPGEVWPGPDAEQPPVQPDSGAGDGRDASRPSGQDVSSAAGSGGSSAPRYRPGEPDVSRSSEDTDAVRPVEVPEPDTGRSGGEGPGAAVEGEPYAHEDNPGGGGRPPGDDLVAELVADGGRVAVSLVGATGDGPGVAYGWRAPGQAPPVATLPVVLGDRDGRHLHLDLGRCPDVLTLAGSLPDCEKYALRLVRQVLTNGHGVAVIGDGLFGDALPAGCRRVATMADIRGLDSPGIVVCGRLTGPDVAAARLSRASGGPTPVIIGEVARSRWALRVNPA